MPPQKNYYDLLALPRTATTAEIKKRYRQLARKYHPDVAGNNVTNARLFSDITEAYKTLVDPDTRSSYDFTLPDTTQPIPKPSAPSQRPSYQPSSTPTRPSAPPEVSKLIKEAEIAFIRRRLDQAKTICKQIIELDRSNARAHVILGDVYRAKHKNEAAINQYTYAVQLDPGDHQTRKKLEKMLEHVGPVRFSGEPRVGRTSNVSLFSNIVGWTLAMFVLLLINVYPGKPIPWIATFHVPFITSWSWNLVGIVAGDAAIVGFLLSVNGIIEHPDDQLIFERGGQGWAIIPTGLILLMFGPVFFPAAAVFYLVCAFAQNSISASVVKILASIVVIVLFTAAVYPTGKESILILGGNVAFIGSLVGWYLGSILRTDDAILS